MLTIWKFVLLVTDVQRVSMPAGAKVLCVQTQDGVPCLWAEVDPNAKPEAREFHTHGTGHALTPVGARRYVGTYQLDRGGLVFHVYEVAE